MPSWKVWYDLTGDPAENQVAIEAGETFVLRFQSTGRYLRSYLAPESLFIDIVMNVGIIFYAAQETANEPLRQTATDHCLTTRRFLVRGDGSAAHEGLFNLQTGEFLSVSFRARQSPRADATGTRQRTRNLNQPIN